MHTDKGVKTKKSVVFPQQILPTTLHLFSVE
jgi:hypothetical protein